MNHTETETSNRLRTVDNAYLMRLRSEKIPKGPVKLIKRVKIAHSFSQSVLNQFHVVILTLPM